MQQPFVIYISAASTLLLALFLLLIFYRRKKSAEHLYHDAMTRESNGRYEEAIGLYQKYLDLAGKSEDERNKQVALRIKTLRILTLG
ncbi:hypothetical protein [Foetidibacter luteolus]|uniref:hypothetical protein n=1 Tax=Foetidibacter luteolus TaxID=2608880 RepID=UPI00129A6023|nr:hypothetical protein [Foetidibacter luteolus]